MEVVNATPRALYPGKWPGTHCIGGWAGPRESLNGCGKYRPHRNSIPGLSSQLTSRYKKQKCAAHLKYWANRRSIKKPDLFENRNAREDKCMKLSSCWGVNWTTLSPPPVEPTRENVSYIKAIPVQAYRTLRLPEFLTVGTWRCQSCQSYVPGRSQVLISVKGSVDPRAILRAEELSQ